MVRMTAMPIQKLLAKIFIPLELPTHNMAKDHRF